MPNKRTRPPENEQPTGPLHPGQIVSNTLVVEKTIGRGGMAVVYQVRCVKNGTRWALKILTRSDPIIRKRLLREGELLLRTHRLMRAHPRQGGRGLPERQRSRGHAGRREAGPDRLLQLGERRHRTALHRTALHRAARIAACGGGAVCGQGAGWRGQARWRGQWAGWRGGWARWGLLGRRVAPDLAAYLAGRCQLARRQLARCQLAGRELAGR